MNKEAERILARLLLGLKTAKKHFNDPEVKRYHVDMIFDLMGDVFSYAEELEEIIEQEQQP